jgi:hypothetical protein
MTSTFPRRPRHASRRPASRKGTRLLGLAVAATLATTVGAGTAYADGQAPGSATLTLRPVADGTEIVLGGVGRATLPKADPNTEVRAIASADGTMVAVLPDYEGTHATKLTVLVVASGKLTTIAREPVSSAVFGPDHRLAYTVDRGETTEVLVGDGTEAGTKVASVPGHGGEALGWTGDGAAVLTATDDPEGGARLSRIDARSGAVTTVLDGQPGRRYYDFRLATVEGSPRVTYFAAGSPLCGGAEVRLSDLDGSTLRSVQVAREIGVRSASFTADGRATYTANACPDKKESQDDFAKRAKAVNGVWVASDKADTSAVRVSTDSTAKVASDTSAGVTPSAAAGETDAAPSAGGTMRVMSAPGGGALSGSAGRTKLLMNKYIHQIHGTEAGFNGSWACSATSAVMALAGYQIKNPWLSHRAPVEYGDYVSQAHTMPYGKATYTAPAPSVNDPYPYDGVYQNGGPIYWPGAYGWTVDGDGYGHAEWIVSYAKAWGANPHYIDGTDAAIMHEIDNGYFVIVGGQYALPAGGGHYAVVVGYTVDSAGKVRFIVNDPYGYRQTSANDGHEVKYTLGEMHASVLIAT